MSSTIVSPLFAELVTQINSGRISVAHLRALLDDPSKILPRGEWIEEFCGMVPRQGRTGDFGLLCDQPYYTARVESMSRLVWGKHASESHGKLQHVAVDEDDGWIFYLTGQKQIMRMHLDGTEQYFALNDDPVLTLKYMEGHLLYIAAAPDGSQQLVVIDLKSTDFQACWRSVWMDRIMDHIYANGSAYYVGQQNNRDYTYQNHTRLSNAMERIVGIHPTQHSIGYVGRPLNGGHYEIHWQENILSAAHPISGVQFVNETPLYARSSLKNGGPQMVYLGDTPQGDMWHDVSYLQWAADKPLYAAKLKDLDNPSWRVVWGNHKYSTRPRVESLIFADGRPAYIGTATTDPTRVQVYLGEEECSKEYDAIFSLRVTEDSLSFGARRGRRLFRVKRMFIKDAVPTT